MSVFAHCPYWEPEAIGPLRVSFCPDGFSSSIAQLTTGASGKSVRLIMLHIGRASYARTEDSLASETEFVFYFLFLFYVFLWGFSFFVFSFFLMLLRLALGFDYTRLEAKRRSENGLFYRVERRFLKIVLPIPKRFAIVAA